MKPQAFQPGELRDEYDQIIRAGAYGKKTPFVNSDNNAILDYIMNNFDALYAQIPNGRAYVKSVNNITPDSNGNVTVNVGTGGGGTGGTNITVDSTLSSTSTNPVQNKVIYAALNNKLDKNGTATYAACDSSGNIISSTYAKKTDLSSYVKSINNMKPDSAGNVNISSSGGGSNITVDTALSGTSSNAIANKAVYAALENKLDKTGTAAAATKATQDSYGNVIVNTYARKSDLSSYVKTINNQEPDTNGNINISTGGGGTGTSITVDTTLSSTSNNPIANKAVYTALNNKLDKTGIAAYATRDSSGNIITDTYVKKSEVSGVVKSVNNIAPDSNGNVTITVSGGGGSGDYLPLTGGTVTGGITATNFQTGTGATSYFQCRKFRGEGNANSYYHAIDFGYSGHDSVDFYEYDPNWNFYKCTTGTKSGAVLVGNINGNGWNGGAQLTGAPTAPTAAVGTNTTQIATTAFVHSAIPTNISSFTNDAGYLTQHQSLVGYVKSVNNTKPDSNGNVTITISGGGGVSTSTQNVWTAQQSFDLALLGVEKYTTAYTNGNSVKPSSVTAVYNATGSFTLDLTNFSSLLSRGQSLVFTAYIKANADYPLTITNGGTLKYTGNSSDLAITSAGLLLNIFITLDNSGSKTSIVQASKLS
ncbi:hypothetical protein [Phascolarctobacterium succinatutens]|uniref:hypothetical protein n=1 Tax=Phascolarctobacterium succinatutens TaxID=626940 RepID=UPI003A8E675B